MTMARCRPRAEVARPALDARQRPLQAQRHAIPIRTVPRAALEALVARLKRQGVGHGG